MVVYSTDAPGAHDDWLGEAHNQVDAEWLGRLPHVYSALGAGNTDPEPEECDPQQWGAPNTRVRTNNYHFDASYEMRSVEIEGGHGHQGCYDAAGGLITRDGTLEALASSGSADYSAPGWIPIGHYNHDVKPFVRAAQLDGNPVDGIANLSHHLIRIGEHLEDYFERRPALTHEPVAPGQCHPVQ